MAALDTAIGIGNPRDAARVFGALDAEASGAAAKLDAPARA